MTNRKFSLLIKVALVVVLSIYIVSVWLNASSGQFYMYSQYGSGILVDIADGEIAFFSKLLIKSALFLFVIYFWTRDIIKKFNS
jgi:hypothetical protein